LREKLKTNPIMTQRKSQTKSKTIGPQVSW